LSPLAPPLGQLVATAPDHLELVIGGEHDVRVVVHRGHEVRHYHSRFNSFGAGFAPCHDVAFEGDEPGIVALEEKIAAEGHVNSPKSC
jgi:hypothetical protein